MSIFAGPEIVNNGLVLALDAGNSKSYPGSGTTWFDLSGNGGNGTLLNGVGYSSNNNGILTFDGTNDYVDLGVSYFISTSIPFTITVWFNGNWRTTGNQFHRIITLRASGTPTLGIAYCTVRTAGYLGLYFGANSGWVNATSDKLVDTGTWNSVTLTYNGLGSTTAGNFKMYLNTTLLPLITTGLTPPAALEDKNFLAVRTSSGEVQIFNGSIPTTYVFNRELTETEVLQNFNALRGRFGI